MGLLTRLAHWVYGGDAAAQPPVKVRALNSSENAASQGTQGVPWTNPDAGLMVVNGPRPEVERFKGDNELDKIPSSNYARPAQVSPAFSLSSGTGDDVAMGSVNTSGGVKTLVGSRHSANTLPHQTIAPRSPFAVNIDYRTAPQGALGAAIGPQQADVPGARTQYRVVPPTDSANVPPAAVPSRGVWG